MSFNLLVIISSLIILPIFCHRYTCLIFYKTNFTFFVVHNTMCSLILYNNDVGFWSELLNQSLLLLSVIKEGSSNLFQGQDTGLRVAVLEEGIHSYVSFVAFGF